MSAVAEIRVRGERRLFVAARCAEDGRRVHAIGRWRDRTGPDWEDVRWSAMRSYTWPLSEVRSIRWLDHPLAALDVTAGAVTFP